MASIQEYLDLIKNAIYGKDVRQAIHDGIQQCYYDGKAGDIDLQARQRLDTDEANISALGSRVITAEGNISNLSSRVDQIVAPSGEAPSAAEVADGRVLDGVTYDLIGEAIRASNENLKSNVKNLNNGVGTLDLYAPFVRGNLQDGVLQPSIYYRVSSNAIITVDKDIRLFIASGFRIALHYFENGSYTSGTSWTQGSLRVPKGTSFKIIIAKVAEELVNADIAEFVNAVTFVGNIERDQTLNENNIGFLKDDDNIVRDAMFYPNLINGILPAGQAIDLASGDIYITESTNALATEFIPVITDKKIYFSKDGIAPTSNNYWFYYLFKYDKELNYLGYETVGGVANYTYTVETDVAFIRVNFNASLTGLQIEYDGITPYHAYGARLGKEQVAKAIELSASRKTSLYLNKGTGYAVRTILLNNGTASFNSGYPAYLYVTDYLRVDEIFGLTLENAESWKAAQANSIAFYDSDKNVIGTAYSPTAETGQVSVTFDIDETLLANYPNAAFCRIGGNTNFGTRLVNESSIADVASPYPTYKVNGYPSIFFGGDSVTEGFVVEGTQQNPQTIYEVIDKYAYPTSFGRIYANADITKVAQSGISPYGYYYNKYPNVDFSEYDLIVIELGLNGSDHGYLSLDDINTENTNSWCYNKLIQGIRSQNDEAQIVLVRSQYFMAGSLDFLKQVASNWDALVLDLHNTDYLDLASPKYHGYYDNNGTPTIDYAHFTRQGYTAKAYVVTRLLGDLLP